MTAALGLFGFCLLKLALENRYFSALQQSLPQALPASLQQAAQLSLQHFLQASPAWLRGAITLSVVTARRERIVFIRCLEK